MSLFASRGLPLGGLLHKDAEEGRYQDSHTDIHPAEIDQLEQNRARMPNMEALYIVLPTTENVERICADF